MEATGMSGDLAFVFPGQGSQQVGMGHDLYAAFAEARAVFDQADEILGFPLSGLCFAGPPEELNDTINTQPALFTTSMACLRVIEARVGRSALDDRLAFMAGHSLGEYSALCAASAIDFAAGLKLVRERGRLMKEAGDVSPGGMAVIIKLDTDVVDEICRQASRETGRPVQGANYNSPGQIVISGDKEALARAMELAEERKARRVIPVNISVAAHSPLMVRANEAFRQAVEAAPLQVPAVPVIANVTARPLDSQEAVHQELVAQLTSPVRWTDSVRYMVEHGARAFVEIGPKEVLKGLIGRIDKGVEASSVGDVASIEALAL
jgi:[acyl-carrier-protein] S-malonyltransferase